MKNILMVALDFPPCQSAGVQRTEKFVEHLPGLGWQPAVLTGQSRIYDQIANSCGEPDIAIYRAFGLNTLKHLSVRGKHFSSMAKPDRFFSWYWHGVMLGEKAIKEHQPDVLWSTFPCSTAMKIALKLKQKNGLPWVADFRDPFSGNNPYFNVDNQPGAVIDKAVAQNADKLVFSTHRSARLYLEMYPFLKKDKVAVISNGFNEEEFSLAEATLHARTVKEKTGTFTLLHSGSLYPGGRDPSHLLKAVEKLKKTQSEFCKADLRIIFRGASSDAALEKLMAQHGLDDIVEFKPTVPYQQSIEEMLTVDGLLLLQGEAFNNQIPGKAYEYLRSGKPILALTHQDGATAELLREQGGTYIADMNSSGEIYQQIAGLTTDKGCIGRNIRQFDRESTTKELAGILEELVK